MTTDKILKTLKGVAPFFIGLFALIGWLIERDGR